MEMACVEIANIIALSADRFTRPRCPTHMPRAKGHPASHARVTRPSLLVGGSARVLFSCSVPDPANLLRVLRTRPPRPGTSRGTCSLTAKFLKFKRFAVRS